MGGGSPESRMVLQGYTKDGEGWQFHVSIACNRLLFWCMVLMGVGSRWLHQG